MSMNLPLSHLARHVPKVTARVLKQHYFREAVDLLPVLCGLLKARHKPS
jgi:hypothetical protein